MTKDYLLLASEIKELEDLLTSIPEDYVIERMSFESRLKSAKAALTLLSPQVASKVLLTFRGKPIFGSHGIAADFGSKAAGAFSDAFVAVAAGLSESLCDIGPIPNRDKNQLLITGTAIGSFGFEFELPPPEHPLFPEGGIPQEAITKIETLFRLAAEGTDDEIAEVIEEVHPRAVKKVYEFLELLVQQQACCALEFADHCFRYASYEQIEASYERLKADNIQEREAAYRGKFQGVLPNSRAFEFQLLDQKDLIKGKIDRTFSDPDRINRDLLHKSVSVKLNVMQVGQGRPRYTLMTIDDPEQ